MIIIYIKVKRGQVREEVTGIQGHLHVGSMTQKPINRQ